MSGVIEQSWVVHVDRKILEDKSKISLYVGDKNSHSVEFVFYKNDKEFIPEKLASYFVRRDGKTVVLSGEQNGNRYATQFSSACYSLPGWHYLFVRCQQDEQNITTVVKIRFFVKEQSDEEEPPCYDPRLDELNDAIDKSNKLIIDIETKLNNGEFDGADGLTPYIGENGNWFIGNVDSGVEASPVGPQGEPGYTPIKGVDYWTDEDQAEINSSKEEASNAAERANSVAERAEVALDSINASIEMAESAADSANEAAVNANNQANQANEAAVNANNQANQANEAAVNANNQANQANEAAVNANNQANQANEAAIHVLQAFEDLGLIYVDGKLCVRVERG